MKFMSTFSLNMHCTLVNINCSIHTNTSFGSVNLLCLFERRRQNHLHTHTQAALVQLLSTCPLFLSYTATIHIFSHTFTMTSKFIDETNKITIVFAQFSCVNDWVIETLENYIFYGTSFFYSFILLLFFSFLVYPFCTVCGENQLFFVGSRLKTGNSTTRTLNRGDNFAG